MDYYKLERLLKKYRKLQDRLESLAWQLEQEEGGFAEHLIADEYDKVEDKIKRTDEKLSALLRPKSEQIERWRHDSEELEAVHKCLTDHNAPVEINGEELSTWGRIVHLFEPVKRD